MSNISLSKNQICEHSLNMSENQLYSCERCERKQKFLQLLDLLTIASQTENYEEQISATVAAISTVYE